MHQRATLYQSGRGQAVENARSGSLSLPSLTGGFNTNVLAPHQPGLCHWIYRALPVSNHGLGHPEGRECVESSIISTRLVVCQWRRMLA